MLLNGKWGRLLLVLTVGLAFYWTNPRELISQESQSPPIRFSEHLYDYSSRGYGDQITVDVMPIG